MNFYEKINQTEISIPKKYTMTSSQMMNLRSNAPDMSRAIIAAFKYGYMRGIEAAADDLKKEPEKEPKYRNEIRKAIYYHVSQNKNTYSLREILKAADIFRRRYDNDLCMTTTALECDQAAVISLMLHCEDGRGAHNIHTFAHTYLSKI